jgi:2-dehydropantoate 2-reductase
MRDVEFAVLGAGAMGSIVAAHLARAGRSVAVLARGQRAAHITGHGLHITGLVDFTVPVRVLTDPTALRGAEVLIVATKALGTAQALAPLRGAAIGIALSVQNGVMKNELLAEAFGSERVLGALANTSGELLPDGRVLFTRNVNLAVGELGDEVSPRAERVALALENAGVRSRAMPRLRDQEWTKFVAWVGLACLSVTTRLSTWKYFSDRSSALVLARIVREAGEVAQAVNVRLGDDSILPVATLCTVAERQAVDILVKMGEEYRLRSPQHRLSTLQDLEAGRPLEIDETIGYAVRKARELGLSLPLLENFFEVATAVDRAARMH